MRDFGDDENEEQSDGMGAKKPGEMSGQRKMRKLNE
jgi:hypothetical protein